MKGIQLIKQSEKYTSQTSPLRPAVNKENALKKNRVRRGLYKDGECSWNADCVGAFNILRLYLESAGKQIPLNPMNISSPYVVKVAV